MNRLSKPVQIVQIYKLYTKSKHIIRKLLLFDIVLKKKEMLQTNPVSTILPERFDMKFLYLRAVEIIEVQWFFSVLADTQGVEKRLTA